MEDLYQTKIISQALINELVNALSGKEYGSVEIYIEAGRVVQITERVIKKTFKNAPKEYQGNSSVVYLKPIRNGK